MKNVGSFFRFFFNEFWFLILVIIFMVRNDFLDLIKNWIWLLFLISFLTMRVMSILQLIFEWWHFFLFLSLLFLIIFLWIVFVKELWYLQMSKFIAQLINKNNIFLVLLLMLFFVLFHTVNSWIPVSVDSKRWISWSLFFISEPVVLFFAIRVWVFMHSHCWEGFFSFGKKMLMRPMINSCLLRWFSWLDEVFDYDHEVFISFLTNQFFDWYHKVLAINCCLDIAYRLVWMSRMVLVFFVEILHFGKSFLFLLVLKLNLSLLFFVHESLLLILSSFNFLLSKPLLRILLERWRVLSILMVIFIVFVVFIIMISDEVFRSYNLSWL